MNVPPHSRGSAAVQAERSLITCQVVLPAQSLVHTAQAGSIVLLTATVVALAWANSPRWESYTRLWETTITSVRARTGNFWRVFGLIPKPILRYKKLCEP
jgi:hypothetical protein